MSQIPPAEEYEIEETELNDLNYYELKQSNRLRTRTSPSIVNQNEQSSQEASYYNMNIRGGGVGGGGDVSYSTHQSFNPLTITSQSSPIRRISHSLKPSKAPALKDSLSHSLHGESQSARVKDVDGTSEFSLNKFRLSGGAGGGFHTQSDEKNQLIQELYSQLEQKNTAMKRANETISRLERDLLQANARIQVMDIDIESYLMELKLKSDEIVSLRNQANYSDKFRDSIECSSSNNKGESEFNSNAYAAVVQENMNLKKLISELQESSISTNEVLQPKKIGENSLNQTVTSHVPSDLLSGHYVVPILENRKKEDSMMQDENMPGSATVQGSFIQNMMNGNHTGQSFMFEESNKSKTQFCLGDRIDKFIPELEGYIERFVENKKYRVRSKNELDFFTQMGKVAVYLKNKHFKFKEEFKEFVEISNKKTEEMKGNMISTLAHVRILKQSTNITITDLEGTVERLSNERDDLIQTREELSNNLSEKEVVIDDLTQKLEYEIEDHNNQKQLNEERMSMIKELQNQIQELQTFNSLSNSEFIQFKDKYFKEKKEKENLQIELEDQIELMNIEQVKLEKKFDEKVQEIETLEINVAELKMGIELEQQGREQDQKDSMIINNQQQQCIQDEQNKILNLIQTIEQLQDRIVQLQNTNELEQIIAEKEQEIQLQLKVKGELELQISAQLEELKEAQVRENFLQEDIRTYKRKIVSLEQKTEMVQPMEEEVKECKEKIDQLELKLNQEQEMSKELYKIIDDSQAKIEVLETEMEVIREKMPLVDEEIQQLVETKKSSSLEIAELKNEVELILYQKKDIEQRCQEQLQELREKHELVSTMKSELEKIESLHQESLMHEKVFQLKRQEELEKRVLELVAQNENLSQEIVTLNRSLEYLNQIDHMFHTKNNQLEAASQEEELISKKSMQRKLKILVFELDNQLKENASLQRRIQALEEYVHYLNDIQPSKTDQESFYQQQGQSIDESTTVMNMHSFQPTSLQPINEMREYEVDLLDSFQQNQ